MNNYSALERFLHRCVLSSNFIREITFDVEQSIFFNKENIIRGEHVFIGGLARSGTTSLLCAIHQSKEFASLTYDDMPFILAPNFWKKIRPKKSQSKTIERAHADGIRISTESPEAFEEVFWKTFSNDFNGRKELFIKFISLILKKNNRVRYLSKNNQNIRRLDLISEICPQSIILIPFRDPLQQAFSLYSQHLRFIKEQKKDIFIRDYMDLIGHSEFGIDYKAIHSKNLSYPNDNEFNHWLEQWYLTYKTALNFFSRQEKIYMIGYESLCGNPNIWVNVKKLLNINDAIRFKFHNKVKTIDQTYDKSLSKKCYSLYQSLLLRKL